MAMIPRLSSMRIFALPLVRPGANVSSKLPVFYAYRINAPPPIKKEPLPRGFFTRWLPEEGLGRWALYQANTTWAGFGAAPERSIKRRAFQLGERLMDQLDFEESNLKTVDLSIAPKNTQVPLLYPPSVLSGPQALDHLKALAAERIPTHNRGIMLYIFFAILSAPLKLIPIIPNFPFYFCAWRTWSHWKAKRAAEYIQALIHSNRIVPTPLRELEKFVYPHMAGEVLSRDALDRAMRVLGMSAEESKELLRAHEQVLLRAGKSKTL
ncbi:mitochondrial K+-H+ exchange-related-domain-containing protein [Mycena sanguinolenta]|nr:mitochondrial K+-H+ exchange-related-domain-containing protein [Mycena sanguinolenta]